MTAFNIVRFRVKRGREQDFIEAHKIGQPDWSGFRRFSIVQTGERSFCFVGEWNDVDAIAAARPQMIAMLDSFRDMLEDLGNGLGVTDPVSGPVALKVSSS